MSSFTCISCRVAFMDADIQRAHYKTDWHRYNLKRKVAELPPVTAENFQQRVLAQRSQVAEKEKDNSSRCAVCNKSFGSKNSYENHLASKKHKDAESRQVQKQNNEVETTDEKNTRQRSVSESVQEKNARNQALKDAVQAEAGPSASGSGSNRPVDRKVQGSSKRHEQEEDDDDEDSDAESWESWEGDALGEEECLFCSYLSEDLESNVQHMTVDHSFFIPDIEYLNDLAGLISYLGAKVGEGNLCLWCNEKGKSFHSTKAVQQHMLDKGHCKMLHNDDTVIEYADFYDYRSSYPDHASGASGTGNDEEEEEDEVEQDVLEEDNYQLVLPSGATVGHRSLMRYFKQKIKPDHPHRNPHSISKVVAQYKALGWTGLTGTVAEKKAKDVAYVQRLKSKHQQKLSVKANKFQPHFRPQVVF